VRNIAEINNSEDEFYRRFGENLQSVLRVAAPGIIQSFDYTTQTATVQLALRERIRKEDLSTEWVNLPLLLDVPIVLPRAGNFVLTMPIQKGDECLVIFADMCIDAWFSNGGVQNQIEKRRHDLSDAFAILGAWSQPNKIQNYSSSSAQLRTLDGSTYIDLKPGQINMVATNVMANGKVVTTSP
jgi:hypothetical protein